MNSIQRWRQLAGTGSLLKLGFHVFVVIVGVLIVLVGYQQLTHRKQTRTLGTTAPSAADLAVTLPAE